MKYIFPFVFLFLIGTDLTGQSFGFLMREKQNSIKIPFEYVSNLMIIDIKINNQLPLKFIFDTGAEHTIITKKEIVEILNLPLGRSFTVLGSDQKTELTAHLVQQVMLSVEDSSAPSQDVLVLEEDYLDFERFTGIQIHGIAAADLFKHYSVRIDYARREINLYKKLPKRLKDYEKLNLEIEQSKPYIRANTSINDSLCLNAKLLIDSGADMSLLINIKTDSNLYLPQNILPGNIGLGLGGFLEGYLGRISKLELGKLNLNNIIGSFQNDSQYADSLNLSSRNGIIGNQILERFTVIIDYNGEALYLKPRKKWKEEFKFDRSGLDFILIDLNRNRFVVQHILDSSPAKEAGFQKGDIILSINRIPSKILDFNAISRILSKKTGKKVRIKLRRRGEKLIKTIVLRDLI